MNTDFSGKIVSYPIRSAHCHDESGTYNFGTNQDVFVSSHLAKGSELSNKMSVQQADPEEQVLCEQFISHR